MKKTRRVLPKVNQADVHSVTLDLPENSTTIDSNSSMEISAELAALMEISKKEDRRKDPEVETRLIERLEREAEARELKKKEREEAKRLKEEEKKVKKEKILQKKKVFDPIKRARNLDQLKIRNEHQVEGLLHRGQPSDYGFPLPDGRKDRFYQETFDTKEKVDRYIHTRNNRLAILDTIVESEGEQCQHKYQFRCVSGNDIIASCEICSVAKLMTFSEYKKHVEELKDGKYYDPEGRFSI